MCDKIDCKTNISLEEKKKHFKMIKRSLHKDNDHTYVGTWQSFKINDAKPDGIKGDINNFIILDLNTHSQQLEEPKKKHSKDADDLNNIINHFDLTVIYRP